MRMTISVVISIVFTKIIKKVFLKIIFFWRSAFILVFDYALKHSLSDIRFWIIIIECFSNTILVASLMASFVVLTLFQFF